MHELLITIYLIILNPFILLCTGIACILSCFIVEAYISHKLRVMLNPIKSFAENADLTN